MKISATISSLSLQAHDKDAYSMDGVANKWFDTTPSGHPIAPTMFGKAKLAYDMSSELMQLGIYAIALATQLHR